MQLVVLMSSRNVIRKGNPKGWPGSGQEAAKETWQAIQRFPALHSTLCTANFGLQELHPGAPDALKLAINSRDRGSP